MKVIFSHGKESGPWGSKIKYLAKIAKNHGCEVQSLDYQGMHDPDARVEKLVRHLDNEQSDYVLVGSSMGGFVSLVAASQLKAKGIFLMAPALYMPGYENKEYAEQQTNVCIVHAWQDAVIPWKNVLPYAEKNQSELHLVSGNHRLISVLEDIGCIFTHYLRKLSSTD